MSQKISLQQLKNSRLEEVNSHKREIQKRKAELEALKAKGDKSWTSTLQKELDDIALFLVDIDDIIEEKTVKTSSYIPAPGTEKMVHVSLALGRRFNPNTGKEESKVFTQLFTFPEWQLFKKNYRNLGYVVMSILHNPYEDAKDIAVKAN